MMNENKKILNKNFMILMLGRIVSDTGTGVQAVVMPLYIIDIGGSAATIGLFTFLALMPALVIYPFAGVFGDRLNRKSIMIGADLLSGVVILALAACSHLGKMNLALLLSVQVIASLLYGFFDPASKGMLPQLIQGEKLIRANSTVESLRTLTGLLSPVIGTVLYVKLGITVLFLINGISFLISGVCEVFIKYKHVKRKSVTGSAGFAADLSDGVRFILGNKIISRMCIFFFIIFALIQPIFTVILPLFFRTKLSYTDTQYGYLQMVFILGALIGSILVGTVFGKDKKVSEPIFMGCYILMGTMLIFSVLLFPASLSVIGKGSMLYVALLSIVLGILSIACMLISVPVQAFIQKVTPNEYMSRIFSIVGMITKGGMPFGALIYGMILSRSTIHWTMLITTILMMMITIGFLATVLNRIRGAK
ncbi:MFS transporter [Clostridium beijerinckii]|nr:MFS transporter [Clostridium beijerinckii]